MKLVSKVKLIVAFLSTIYISNSYCDDLKDIDKGFEAVKVAQENLEEATIKAKKIQAFSFFNNLQEKQNVSFSLMKEEQDSNMNVEMHHSCNMNMFIYPSGFIKPVWLSRKKYSLEELKSYNELVFYHEFSHCEYAQMDKFYLPGIIPNKIKKLNFILDVTQRDDKRDFISDVARLQMENFADIYGSLVYLKINGVNAKTIQTVQTLLMDRQALIQYWIENFNQKKLAYTINPYDCATGIEHVLAQKDNIESMSINQMKELALQWASEKTQQVVNQESPDFTKHIPYNLDTQIAMKEVYLILKN